jgi:hypothetical protein
MAIHLGRASPHTSSDLPGDRADHTSQRTACPPIWSCSGWGLPCHRCCQRRGALLPHHFTLTGPEGLRRYVFCGTFRRLAPPRRYLAPCPAEPGLSSLSKRDSDHSADSRVYDSSFTACGQGAVALSLLLLAFHINRITGFLTVPAGFLWWPGRTVGAAFYFSVCRRE